MCRLDIPQTLRCKRNIIFGNIEKIAEFHSCYFLRDLQNCNGNPMLIANTFQLHVSLVYRKEISLTVFVQKRAKNVFV